jgi:flagellar basal-body rod protein FlgC
MQAMEISRTGLDVEWRRLELIAQNIANADVGRASSANVYKAQQLITGPSGAFARALVHAGSGDTGVDTSHLKGVSVFGIEQSGAPPRRVHEPSNAAADASGYVSYPAIDHAEQMTLMVKTARAYEANIVAMNAAREMYSKALELGKRS